jgi:hypothetical protein
VKIACLDDLTLKKKKTVKTTKQNGARRKTHRPKEHGGTPQHQHGPKRREDRNPKYHEVQQKDVA